MSECSCKFIPKNNSRYKGEWIYCKPCLSWKGIEQSLKQEVFDLIQKYPNEVMELCTYSVPVTKE